MSDLRTRAEVPAPNAARRRALAGMACAAIVAAVAFRPSQLRAQGTTEPRRIGILSNGHAGDPRVVALLAKFRDRLAELGHVEGRSIRLDVRFSEGITERLPGLAQELVGLKVDVIVAFAVAASLAARQATSQTPIVMVTAGNAVGAGLIASLARPGGNVTGTTSMLDELGAKQLGLLREVVPTAQHIALLVNSTNPGTLRWRQEASAAAQGLAVGVTVVDVVDRHDFEKAFLQIERSGAQALLVSSDPMIHANALSVIEFAARRKLPALYGIEWMVQQGGLMSYGPRFDVHFRRAAEYVDRILKGARPADLPAEQPTAIQMLVNLKTARALGLEFPKAILAAADEVIE